MHAKDLEMFILPKSDYTAILYFCVQIHLFALIASVTEEKVADKVWEQGCD